MQSGRFHQEGKIGVTRHELDGWMKTLPQQWTVAIEATFYRFRRYWTHLSKRSGNLGRPAVSFEIRELIRTMALANGLWRSPRIHGELQKLGIEVSERTVSRILRTVKRPPSQTLEDLSAQSHRGSRCG
jgi:hypothetical protein